MKDAYWFTHDSNSRHDPRIIKLRRTHGAEGYGVFFMIIEILREQEDYTLDFNDESIMDIAYEIQVDNGKVNDIICNYNLFTVDEDVFYSNSLKRRMEKLDLIKEKRSYAGQMSAKARANIKQVSSKRSTSVKGVLNYNRIEHNSIKEKNYSAKFEQFWHEYPSKIGKKKAFTSFKAVKEDVEVLITAVKQQINSKQWKAGYIPHPATWLNQGRWEDDVEALNVRGNGKPLSDDEYEHTKKEKRRLEENKKLKELNKHIWD